MNTRTWKLGLALVLLLFLAVRLWDFQREYSKDEAIWVWATVYDVGVKYWDFHPPIGITLYTLGTKVLGAENLRLLPIGLSALLFLVTLHYGRKWYDERTALAAGLLMALSYYSVMAAQLIDMDGAWLALLNFLIVAQAWDWSKERHKGWWRPAFLGLLLGLTLLTRISNFIVLAPAAFILWRNRKSSKPGHALLVPLAIAAAALLAWVAWDQALFGGQNVASTLEHNSGGVLAQLQNLPATLNDKAIYAYVVQRKLTPPLVALFLLALAWLWKKDSKNRETHLVLFAWVAAFALFYALPFGGEKTRYFSAVLAPSFLLMGRALSSALPARVGAREWALAGLGAVLAFGALWLGGFSEWEVVENFVPFTAAKYAIALVPLAALYGFAKGGERWRQAFLLLAGLSVGFSLYYLSVASTEKDSSWLVGQMRSLDGPLMGWGEYGMCYYFHTRNIKCGSIGEVATDPSKYVVGGQYLVKYSRDNPSATTPPIEFIDKSGVDAYLKREGIRYLTVTKKVITRAEFEVPARCGLVRHYTRHGEELGRLYSCPSVS